MKVFTKTYPQEAEAGISGFRATIKRMFFGFCLPGAVIALATGLYQFMQTGAGYYMKLGWFHTKLTLVVILFVVTFLAAQEVRKIGNSEVLTAKKSIALHAITSACMIAIIFLTILNR